MTKVTLVLQNHYSVQGLVEVAVAQILDNVNELLSRGKLKSVCA